MWQQTLNALEILKVGAGFLLSNRRAALFVGTGIFLTCCLMGFLFFLESYFFHFSMLDHVTFENILNLRFTGHLNHTLFILLCLFIFKFYIITFFFCCTYMWMKVIRGQSLSLTKCCRKTYRSFKELLRYSLIDFCEHVRLVVGFSPDSYFCVIQDIFDGTYDRRSSKYRPPLLGLLYPLFVDEHTLKFKKLRILSQEMMKKMFSENVRENYNVSLLYFFVLLIMVFVFVILFKYEHISSEYALLIALMGFIIFHCLVNILILLFHVSLYLYCKENLVRVYSIECMHKMFKV